MDGDLPAEAFFDALADEYHLMFEDWWEAAEVHGEVVGRVLGDLGVFPGARVLDCTCGIGTQALPLARHGYRVVGADLSTSAIDRARREAQERHIEIDLFTCDVREVGRRIAGPFEAVLACDNSLACLLTEDDLLEALRSIRACLDPGGTFLASLRDYDRLSRERPDGLAPVTYSTGGKRIVGQAWEWSASGDLVLIRLFILTEQNTDWACSLRTTRLRAWHRSAIDEALEAAGFDVVTWHAAGDTGYYQPIVTARARPV